MSTSSELAVTEKPRTSIVITDDGVSLRSFDEMARFSQAVLNSGLAPKAFNSPEAVMVAIQAGLEIGLKPMQALQGIAVINGRPTLWGDAAMAVVCAHPEFADIEETFEGTGETARAVCRIRRKGRSDVVRDFSYTDAKKAGLWGKAGPWSQYPKRMMQMRARSFAMRDSFPDALKGCGIREEVQDYTPQKSAAAREVKPAAGLVLPDTEPPVGESVPKDLENLPEQEWN